MNKSYGNPRRFSASGLATACILALIVAMGISAVLDIKQVERSAVTTTAHNGSAHA
jgi:hypothetical protein